MNTNIKNKTEKDIKNMLYLVDYLYEEAFMLDRDIIGEEQEYMEFLNYAYDELEKQGKVNEYTRILKAFIYETIISADVLSSTLLYINFNAIYNQIKQEEKQKVLSRFGFKKVV